MTRRGYAQFRLETLGSDSLIIVGTLFAIGMMTLINAGS